MKAIKELKLRLPNERKAKGHSSTLNALKYALQCVKQVRGEGVFLFVTSSDNVPLLVFFSAFIMLTAKCIYILNDINISSQQGVLPSVECRGMSRLQS